MDIREAALEELCLLARHVTEADPEDAALRLLERVTATRAPELLRAALVELGALRLLEDVRAQVVLRDSFLAGLEERA